MKREYTIKKAGKAYKNQLIAEFKNSKQISN